MATIGKLIFEMSANVARLQEDMRKARSTVESTMGSIKSAVNLAKGALAGLGVSVGAMEFTHMIEGAIGAQDALAKLSQRTGVSAEMLSGMRLAAKQAGTDMDTVGTVINRLEKTMLGFATEPTEQMKVAFGALGLSQKEVEDGLKHMDTFLPDLAKRLASTGTAAEQAALAQVLFGRAGAQTLPFLRQLAETAQIHAERTKEEIEAAERLHDQMEALEHRTELLKESLANALVPTLTDVIEQFNKAKSAAAGFQQALGAAFASHDVPADIGARLKEVNAQIERAKSMPVLPGFLPGGASLNLLRNADLGRLQAERGFLLAQQREQALALTKGMDTSDQVSRQFQRPLDLSALVPERKHGAGGSGASPYEAELKRLKEEVLTTQKLTATEKVLAEIDDGRYGALSKNQKDALVRLTAQIDVAKEDAKTQQQIKQITEEAQRKELEHRRQIDQEAESVRRLIDPTRQYKEELEKIDALLQSGAITMTEATEASIKVSDQMDAVLERVNKKASDANDIGRQLGLTMTSAFEKAVTGGESFRKVLQGLDRDIAQIIMRKTITEPLGSAISNAVSGSGISGFFSNIFSSIFGGGKAAGGPVSAGTPYLVGEAGPELFVPPGSGSIVPNSALNGGAGDTHLHVNVQLTSLDPRSALQVIAPLKDTFVAWTREAWNRRGYVTPFG